MPRSITICHLDPDGSPFALSRLPTTPNMTPPAKARDTDTEATVSNIGIDEMAVENLIEDLNYLAYDVTSEVDRDEIRETKPLLAAAST